MADDKNELSNMLDWLLDQANKHEIEAKAGQQKHVHEEKAKFYQKKAGWLDRFIGKILDG